MLKLAILIVVDIIAVTVIIAFFMSARRRGDHRSLRKPAPGRWNWSLAARKQPADDTVKASEDTEAPEKPALNEETAGAPMCSLCGAPMVLVPAQKDINRSKPFYRCGNFPKCENTGQYISLKDTKMMRSILK